MSAECSKCGHDLGYYGGCVVCTQRERAENAERELAAARGSVSLPNDPGIHGECQVCGGETEHHPNCEVGALSARVASLEAALREIAEQGPGLKTGRRHWRDIARAALHGSPVLYREGAGR